MKQLMHTFLLKIGRRDESSVKYVDKNTYALLIHLKAFFHGLPCKVVFIFL
jgi:hypothetical protein